MSTIQNNLDFRCTLEIHVRGKLLRGAQVEYLGAVIAQSKVDPDFFSFYDLMTVIKECGYSQEDNISVFYRLPNTDMNNGLVALTSHDEMLNMFATHSPGMKYFSIDMYVDCDSEDEEVIGRDTNTVDQGCITELGSDLQVEEGQGGVDLGVEEGHEIVDLDIEGVVQGVDANETDHREFQMDGDDSSDIEWLPYDDSSTSTGSFSGVEESSDEEEEDNIPLVGLGKNLGQNIGDEEEDLSSDSDDNNLECEVAMETTMVEGHEIEVAQETRANSGRCSGRGGRGRGKRRGGKTGRGGKSARGGKTGRGSGAMVVGGTGRGGDPASMYGTIAPRGRGRGRGATTAPPLPGIVIREQNPNTRVDIGTDKGVNCGKGKQPIVLRGKAPITRFGGAPRVGLPAPQGWRRSTRMGNAIFGLNQKLHLQHHVAVVVEVAVPQCQSLNHQVQPQVPRNQPLDDDLCYASSACNRIGPVILKLFCSVSAATALFCSVIAGEKQPVRVSCPIQSDLEGATPFSSYSLIHPRNLLPGFFTVSDVRITTLRPHLHLSSPSY
ncbi:hypothetical protein RHGRI_032499 [Rhododendron griersonianum]|uniref:PB1-like domain-containing protein n=1 Tax=Rhododendron griersonianum TaxID=479676 RepID=A0AAV6ICM1_9ERIC|nr:hypothetical protein RHGRI_032499 [Rhododendron griersonianum]